MLLKVGLSAPSRGNMCTLTNLEILCFVCVDVAHVSFQIACVEESLGAARKFASGESKVQMRSKLSVVLSNQDTKWLTGIASLRCAEACGGSGEPFERNDDCSRQMYRDTDAVDINTQVQEGRRRAYALTIQLTRVSLRHWCGIASLSPLTAPVCTVSCSFSRHCLVKVAPQAAWSQVNSCGGGGPPAGFSLGTPFMFLDVWISSPQMNSDVKLVFSQSVLWPRERT